MGTFILLVISDNLFTDVGLSILYLWFVVSHPSVRYFISWLTAFSDSSNFYSSYCTWLIRIFFSAYTSSYFDYVDSAYNLNCCSILMCWRMSASNFWIRPSYSFYWSFSLGGLIFYCSNSILLLTKNMTTYLIYCRRTKESYITKDYRSSSNGNILVRKLEDP